VPPLPAQHDRRMCDRWRNSVLEVRGPHGVPHTVYHLEVQWLQPLQAHLASTRCHMMALVGGTTTSTISKGCHPLPVANQ
jgi:hypothetical protein